MTLRTLFLTLMLFTCAILMALGLSASSTIQSIERAEAATQFEPTSRAAQATLFAQASRIVGTATKRAAEGYPTLTLDEMLERPTANTLTFKTPTNPPPALATLYAQATQLILGATQTVQAEATLTGTP